MPRDPNNPNSRSSAEWDGYVTVNQFNNFLLEFRGYAQGTNGALAAINKELNDGNIKFAGLQRDATECGEQRKIHADLILALSRAEADRKIREEIAAKRPEPMGPIASAAITAVITVAVTATMGFIYKLVVLDVKAEEKTEKNEAHPVHHTSP